MENKKKRFSNKHVFWQALIVALVILWVGIMLGIFFEGRRVAQIEDFYSASETDLLDANLQSDLFNMFGFECGVMTNEVINFADRIYEEAVKLEKYDSSNELTDDIIVLHKKYDLLRTMLWKNAIVLQKECSDEVDVVVYLYDYVDTDVNTKAKQLAMGRVLIDMKDKYGDKVILIPIAHDTGVDSLNLFKEKYDLDKFPVVIINQKDKITGLFTLEDIEEYLDL